MRTLSLILVGLLFAIPGFAQESQTQIIVRGDSVGATYCQVSPSGVDFTFTGALQGQSYSQRVDLTNIGDLTCIATAVDVFRIKPDGTETPLEDVALVRDVVEAAIPQQLLAGESADALVHWNPQSEMDGEDTFRIDITWVTDNPPPPPPPPEVGRLTLVKTVINDEGGTAVAADFNLLVNGVPVDSGYAHEYTAGIPLTLNEGFVANYVLVGISGDASCPSDLGIPMTLDPDDDVVCTITNDDVPATYITLSQVVVNDDGGTGQASDFTLVLVDSTMLGHVVAAGVPKLVSPGTYLASSTAPGYSIIFSGDCSILGAMTVASGESKACTLTYDDDAPAPDKGFIYINKIVINDNGGTAEPGDFVLSVNGTLLSELSGQTHDVTIEVAPGSYWITEVHAPGYVLAGGEDCLLSAVVTIAAGETKSCILTNDDVLIPTDDAFLSEPPSTRELVATFGLLAFGLLLGGLMVRRGK